MAIIFSLSIQTGKVNANSSSNLVLSIYPIYANFCFLEDKHFRCQPKFQ